MLNNADWLLDLNYVELLREVGACFSVNNMLRAECYKPVSYTHLRYQHPGTAGQTHRQRQRKRQDHFCYPVWNRRRNGAGAKAERADLQ